MTTQRPTLKLLAFATALLVTIGSTALAEAPHVMPQGDQPHDVRLGPLKDLNGYFPMRPCATAEQWAERSERVRRQILVATGLWPMPRKTPAKAVIHGRVDRPEYTVEKVYFESFPGHYVTGNLYRPKKRSGRLPGVLCPHGHWANGRFYDAGEEKVKDEIAQGAEKFEVGGRHPIQARCVTLARLGCVVFQYDMVGYADSKQIVHRPGVRKSMNTPQNWGYFSPQAEARQQNMMGLQTYNSIRALDFLAGLPDVDPERLGVTGASGGGTQTFILCAIDPRPAVAFPAVMVSTAMQGGCTCENACYLRIGTSNVEFAALFSPKPLGMTAANDWTREMATKGFPELKQHYEMLGVGDRVMLTALTQFGHNYNYVSRAAMYAWLNKHLYLGADVPVVEEDYRPLSIEEMSVWDDDHPQPPGGEEHERALLRWITEDSDRQMAALLPKDKPGLARYRKIIGGAVDVMIGRGLADKGAVEATEVRTTDRGDFEVTTMLLNHAARHEQVPAVHLRPKQGNGRAVLWIDRHGKQGLFDTGGQPTHGVQKLLAAGVSVVGIDLLGQGELTADGKPMTRARLVNRDKEGRPGYAGYTFGYNHPLFSQRVHDILTAISYLHSDPRVKGIDLLGLDGAGHWVAAARAQAGGAVRRAVVDTAGFRFANLTELDDLDFLPGGAKYGDMPGIVALSAPHPTWLVGEGWKAPPVVTAAYKAAGKEGNLTVYNGDEDGKQSAALAWLCEE